MIAKHYVSPKSSVFSVPSVAKILVPTIVTLAPGRQNQRQEIRPHAAAMDTGARCGVDYWIGVARP